MSHLIAASMVYLLMHRVVSGSSLRDIIVARVGERRFEGWFAFASVAALIWLGISYWAVEPVYRQALWSVPAILRFIQVPLQFVALLLMVCALAVPNPAAVRQQKAVDREHVVQGALRVTRHPFLWGVILLSLGHMAVAPTPRSLLLFSTLAVTAAAGTHSIDAKRRRRLKSRWAPYQARTSNIPFIAVVTGRQAFMPREFGLASILIAGVLTLAAALLHPAYWLLLQSH